MRTRPIDALRAALYQLRKRRGDPSTRQIAVGINMSHTTVARVFSPAYKPPTYRTFARIVEFLGGDLNEFLELWIATYGVPGDIPAHTSANLRSVRVRLSAACADDLALACALDKVNPEKLILRALSGYLTTRLFRESRSRLCEQATP